MAIIAATASCQKNELIDYSFSDDRMKEVIFSAGIDEGEQTKAFILDWSIYWADGDMLGGWSSQTQIDKTKFYRFDEQSLETGEQGKTSEFSGTVENDVTKLRLFYPYDINADVIDEDNKYAMDLTSQKVDMYDAAVGYLSAKHIYMSSDELTVDGDGNITDEEYTLYQVGSIVNLQLTLEGLPTDEPYYLRKVTLGNFYAKANYDFTQSSTDDADITDKEYASIAVEVENSRAISATQVMSVPVYILPTDLPENYVFTIEVECSSSDGTKEYKGTLEHTQETEANCERGKYYSAPRTVTLNEVQKVTNATEAQTAFTSGADNVVITEQISATSSIEINNSSDASKSLTFDEGIAADQTVTIEVKDNTKNLDITTTADNEGSITVNAPNTTVTINGKVVNAEVLTATDTFIVEEGAEITGTLTVTGGNVEIYGQVAAVAFDASADASVIKVWTVYDEAQFKAAVASERVDKIVLANDIELDETLTIANAMSIDGSEYTVTMTDSGRFILDNSDNSNVATFIFNNITLDASTAIAALYLNSSNIELITNSATIIQSKYSTTGFSAGSAPAIEVNQTAFADNITMTFNDTAIKLTGGTGTKTGINIYGSGTNEVENYSITFNNSSIIADKNSSGSQTLYAQAMCLGNIKELDIKMYNSTFQDMSYPIYCTNVTTYELAPEMTFLIDNSTIDGWCAMNLRCTNSTITVQNGSKLIGRNFQSGSSNGYSVIVMSGYTGSSPTAPYVSQVSNTTINIVDSYMLAESYGNAGEYLIHERNIYNKDNNVINLKGTTILESNKMSGDYTYVDPFYMKYSPMDEITISGVTKAGESNLTVNRDATVELKTNMTGMRFSEGLIVGSGTDTDPYQIFDNADLSIVKYYSTATYSSHFIQMAHIEYEYTPYVIGSTPAYNAPTVTVTNTGSTVSGMETTYAVACNLNGTYDGNGFSINNFRYDAEVLGSNTSDQLVGLFNTVKPNSTIKNLSLTTDSNVGITITSENCNPSAMKVGSFAGKLEGTITGCSSELPISVYGTDADFTGVAGIAGWFASDHSTYVSEVYATEITKCTYSGNLEVTNAGVGAGLTAYCNAYWGVIEYNEISGNITAPTAYGSCVSDYDDGNNTITGTVTSTAE